MGIVLSRYDGVDGSDWIAIPLVPYLYAVERPEDVPLFADVLEMSSGTSRISFNTVPLFFKRPSSFSGLAAEAEEERRGRTTSNAVSID